MATLQGGCYCSPHFVVEESGSKRLNNFIKVTQLVLKFNSRSTDFNTALLTKLSEKQDKVGGDKKRRQCITSRKPNAV